MKMLAQKFLFNCGCEGVSSFNQKVVGSIPAPAVHSVWSVCMLDSLSKHVHCSVWMRWMMTCSMQCALRGLMQAGWSALYMLSIQKSAELSSCKNEKMCDPTSMLKTAVPNQAVSQQLSPALSRGDTFPVSVLYCQETTEPLGVSTQDTELGRGDIRDPTVQWLLNCPCCTHMSANERIDWSCWSSFTYLLQSIIIHQNVLVTKET